MISALRKLYESREWAFLEQVRGGTGAQGSRYADGLAVSLFPSRGIQIIGFEVKVSRSDWLAELKSPEKADEVFSFCDRWYLATVAGVVREGELPQPWGLLLLDAQTMNLSFDKEAPQLEPQPLRKSFVASICRNLANNRPGKEELTGAEREGYGRGYADAEKRFKKSKDVPIDDYHFKSLKDSVDKFEMASGIKIEIYNGQRLGESVKKVMDGENALRSVLRQVPHIKRQISDLLKDLERVQVEEEVQA